MNFSVRKKSMDIARSEREPMWSPGGHRDWINKRLSNSQPEFPNE
jgi:hypothetical protein